MSKPWRDEHLKTCTCKACAMKPTFATKRRPVLGSLGSGAPLLVEGQVPKPLPFGLLKCDEITPDSIFDDVEPAPAPAFEVESNEEPGAWNWTAVTPPVLVETGGVLYVGLEIDTQKLKEAFEKALPVLSPPVLVDSFSYSFIEHKLVAMGVMAPDEVKQMSGFAQGGVISEEMVWKMYDVPLGPSSPPPDVELLDSSNPFARALDAWQTGKAGWTKGALYRPMIDDEIKEYA